MQPIIVTFLFPIKCENSKYYISGSYHMEGFHIRWQDIGGGILVDISGT